jgi:hypothetical protein
VKINAEPCFLQSIKQSSKIKSGRNLQQVKVKNNFAFGKPISQAVKTQVQGTYSK